MTSVRDYDDIFICNGINNPMFIIDSSALVALKFAAKRLRFSYSFKWIRLNGFKKFKYFLQEFNIVLKIKPKVFKAFTFEDNFSHGSGSLSKL